MNKPGKVGILSRAVLLLMVALLAVRFFFRGRALKAPPKLRWKSRVAVVRDLALRGIIFAWTGLPADLRLPIPPGGHPPQYFARSRACECMRKRGQRRNH